MSLDLPLADLEFPSWLQEEPPTHAAPRPRRRRSEPPYELEVLSGPSAAGRRFALRGRCVRIGRSPDCEVRLDSRTVSRFHAVVDRDEEGLLVRDLQSLNGVVIGGARRATHRLRDGDQLVIGAFRLAVARRDGPRRPRSAAPAPSGAPESDPAAETLMGEAPDEPPGRRRRGPQREAAPAALVGAAGSRHVLEGDAFTIGGGDSADLRLGGWWVPRLCAVVVRRDGRYSLHALSGWPFAPRVNGDPVRERRALAHDDEVSVAGFKLKFREA